MTVKVEPMSNASALIVIDVQNDFCEGGALEVPQGSKILKPIKMLMNTNEAIVLTQDWHPAQHKSFASNHPHKLPYSLIDMPYGPQVLWPDHCVQGTYGAQFHDNLETNLAQLVIRKGFRPSIDSYSAFFENDQETVTGLDGYLKSRNIGSVTLCGLALDFCVFYTAMDACKLGYQVTVETEACRAIDLKGSLTNALADMKSAGVVLK